MLQKDLEKIFQQIDLALAACHACQTAWNDMQTLAQAVWLGTSTLTKLTSVNSLYHVSAVDIAKHASSVLSDQKKLFNSSDKLRGMLNALRKEYENGYFTDVSELVRAETFTDFLDQAEYLMSEGYKDSAAVIMGGVLEQHIKSLCIKNLISMSTLKPNGETRLLKLHELNAELAKANVYNKAYQKSITSFLAVRNAAAHGKWDEYTAEQVKQTLGGVTAFIASNPA